MFCNLFQLSEVFAGMTAAIRLFRVASNMEKEQKVNIFFMVQAKMKF
jgi:hypothetical protein